MIAPLAIGLAVSLLARTTNADALATGLGAQFGTATAFGAARTSAFTVMPRSRL